MEFVPLEASRRVTNGIPFGCPLLFLTKPHCKLRPNTEGNFFIDDDTTILTIDKEDGECAPSATLLEELKSFAFTAVYTSMPHLVESVIAPWTAFGPASTAGTYNLATIFDSARLDNGVKAHVYRCLLVTDNEVSPVSLFLFPFSSFYSFSHAARSFEFTDACWLLTTK
jgi:hypothetical protein